MQEKYIKINNLQVSEKLSNFVNDELLKNTNVSAENFWLGLEKTLDELAPKNKELIPLNKFFTSYRKTRLKKGQFIYSVKIPIYKKNIFKAYKISKRFDDDISSVCASFNLEIINKKIKKIAIAFGGMAEIPKRATNCEKILRNKNLSLINFENVNKSLEKDFKPIDDMRATKNYRIEVAKNLLTKCFLEIESNKLIRLN